MRKIDKLKQIEKANILAEQRHLKEDMDVENDATPKTPVDINQPLSALLNYYSTPQIFDAMAEWYNSNGESKTVKQLKTASDAIRQTFY